MQNIVAIGGGQVRELSSINREIVRLARRRRPFALYIPTASKDALEGWEDFRRTYARLGFLPGMLCPHYHHKDRRVECRRMIRRRGMSMVAVDDHAAIEVIGDRFLILTARRQAGVWLVSRRNGRVIERRIPRQRDPQPLSVLQ